MQEKLEKVMLSFTSKLAPGCIYLDYILQIFLPNKIPTILIIIMHNILESARKDKKNFCFKNCISLSVFK